MQFPIIRLAIPTRAAAAFDHPDWVFELKHDGFRALAQIADGRCNLISRKNNVYKSFGPLREALRGLRVRDAVLVEKIYFTPRDWRIASLTLSASGLS
jgi:bifunctional non-homologous end joining protein LigD